VSQPLAFVQRLATALGVEDAAAVAAAAALIGQPTNYQEARF